MKKGFKLNATNKFFNILLNREFINFFGYRNKIQALTEDGFLCVGKRKNFWNSNYGAKTFNRRVTSIGRTSDEGLALETSAFESLCGG